MRISAVYGRKTAIFGITSDPFIVFTSNAFAILGLRNLYFLLADAKDRFHYLSAGLGFVLMWIGVKMILPAIDHDWKVPPLVSLVIVISILTISIVASLLRTRRIARKAPRATKARRPARARKRWAQQRRWQEGHQRRRAKTRCVRYLTISTDLAAVASRPRSTTTTLPAVTSAFVADATLLISVLAPIVAVSVFTP